MNTLNELLSKSAQEWSESEVLQLIEALRTQREHWNQEQQAGSKKRVTATSVAVKPAKRDLAFEGLKL
jgi:hypothetical protein